MLAEDLTNVLLDGRYRLTRLMGEGGMGQVYEGIHETLERKVAVKVLLPRYAYEPKFRERFLREAKAASKVRHPNVVHILDFGDTPGGSVYFAMEFLEGRDLAQLLRAEGALPWPRARLILLQALSALAAAHERSIIHRDIKPANFFVEEDAARQDLVKVLDFGIAKLAAGAGKESSLAQSLTGTGEVFGTAKYMAPEQAYGASDDPRVDVYSLGVVAYELLTGQVPFDGTSVFAIITRHVNERPRPPRELAPAIPAEVEAWILRALAKRPDDRFASMVEMEQALLAIGAASVPRTMPLAMPVPGALAHGPRAAVSPAQVEVTSPVTGELARGSEDSWVGAATARLPGLAHDGSATGPMLGPGSSSRAAETDVLGRHPTPRGALRKRGLVLGLLGTLGAVAAVVAAYLVMAASDEAPATPSAVVAPQEVAPPESGVADEPRVNGAGSPAGERPAAAQSEVDGDPPAPREPAQPESAPPIAAEEPPPEPESEPGSPADREVKGPSKPSKPSGTKPTAPLTDADVARQLARALKKKCGALGQGTAATVSVVVGSKGTVLSKSVRGATGELAQCLAAGAAAAKFPAGTTRTVPVEVAL